MSKIDEKTVVPLGWAVAGFSATLGFVVLGAFWVSTVNYRLMRIEDKLGIPRIDTAGLISIPVATAAESKKH